MAGQGKNILVLESRKNIKTTPHLNKKNTSSTLIYLVGGLYILLSSTNVTQ